MPKPKGNRQTNSAKKQTPYEPIEIEVRFTGPDPAPPVFPGAKPTPPPAKKSDKPDRPGVTFRL